MKPELSVTRTDMVKVENLVIVSRLGLRFAIQLFLTQTYLELLTQ